MWQGWKWNSTADGGPDNWMLYNNHIDIEVSDFLFHCYQMSAGDINFILDLWVASLAAYDDTPSFSTSADMYNTIDANPLGDVPWQSISLQYNRAKTISEVPLWMKSNYDVWFWDPHTLVLNLLSNLDFDHEFDYAPFQEHTADGVHHFQDFMSVNWAWKQAICPRPRLFWFKAYATHFQDIIAVNPKMRGSVLHPIILGSDKTMVSVATGHNEYWPIYLSIGNIHNNTQWAHHNGVVLLGFFAIPKSKCCISLCSHLLYLICKWLNPAINEFHDDATFYKFCHQLLHSSLVKILKMLKPGMMTPDITHFPDGHVRQVMYGLGPYIANYPEQALLACIMQGWYTKYILLWGFSMPYWHAFLDALCLRTTLIPVNMFIALRHIPSC